ncbi:hypothetical protein ACR6C2_09195 [Streptomyces sp. INA 01156]
MISPAAVSRSTRSATVGRDRPVSCFNCLAVSGPSCWSSRRAFRSLMALAVLGMRPWRDPSRSAAVIGCP